MNSSAYPFAINPPLFLAPMAGVTDLPSRQIARKFGAVMAFTEMVSAKALIMESEKTWNILSSNAADCPLGVQLFGADPDVMAMAAMKLEKIGTKLIDINMGCPVKKVIKTFSGAYLLKDKERAEKILRRVIQSVNIPVTVKIRSGWNCSDEKKSAVELSQLAEECGVAAVTVHGRTAAQGYTGKADWSVISEVKQNVSIPVIGNGDIKRPEDSLEMLRTTGCDGVMIGRASIGNPWIFKGCAELMSGNPVSAVSPREKCDVINDHLMSMINYYGERIGIKKMRSHLLQYAKGYAESAKFRAKVVHINNKNELLDEVEIFFLNSVK